jgi:hypothetical protein
MEMKELTFGDRVLLGAGLCSLIVGVLSIVLMLVVS